MTRYGNDAIAWARDHMTWPQGYCLQWVRSCFDVGSHFASATDAWEGADRKHPTERGSAVPRGAPCYWTGGSQGYGHIALGVGKGYCLSTDAGGAGHVAKVKIDVLTSRWGLNFRGWAEDVNEVQVVNPKEGKPAAGWERVRISAVGPGKRNKDVEVVKRRLIQKVGNERELNTREFKDYWGNDMTGAYREWQRRLGFSGRDADGMPGHYSLRKLGLEVEH